MAFENVTALLPIGREEMKVVSRNTERAGEAGDQMPTRVPVMSSNDEFLLAGSRGFKLGALGTAFMTRVFTAKTDPSTRKA